MFYLGAQRVVATGGGSELPPPGSTPGIYEVDHPAIAYSDCVAPAFISGWARFVRPVDDGPNPNYRYAMPGARMRFRSNAPSVTVGLRWNGLVTRDDARNLIGHVFIDGVYNRDFQTPAAVNVVTSTDLVLNMGSSSDRLFEIILPYADGVEFGRVAIDPAYAVTAATARAGRLMVCLGDSITQGFWTTDVRRGWVFKLAESKGFRAINMGFGGRLTIPGDGTIAANLAPDLILILLGTNDFLNQRPLADVKADYKQLLMNIYAINPAVPVYASAPIMCTASRAIPLSDYQAIPGQCIAELGYAQLHGVNTATLINSTSQLNPDGVHPNDAGATQMVAGWGAVVV